MIRFLAAFCVWLAWVSPAVAQSAPAWVLPNDARYKTVSSELLQIVKDSLKDEESARIEPMLVCIYRPDLKVGIVRVNAKNAYGAYTGYTTMLPVQDTKLRQTLVVRSNPYGAEQFDEQRAILSLLKSCDSAIKAYDAYSLGLKK